MTGYQETVTDPSYAEQLVCFTTSMVGNYGVADERGRVERAPRACGAHALARRRRVGRRGCASTGSSAWTRSTRARSSCDCATRARCGRPPSPTRARSPVADALEQVRAQPSMEGQALVAQVSTPEPYVFAETGSPARRRRRLRGEALDHAAARASAGAAVTVCPHTTPADELAGLRRRRPLERTRRPGAARRRDRDRARSPRPRSRSSGSASVTSSSASRPATRRTSSRSAIAARTTRCSSGAPAACS